MDMNFCNVTVFRNATDTHNALQAGVGALFECIRTGGSIKGQIEEIRKFPIACKKKKLELPVIMWQGMFTHRVDNGLRSLSSLMCVDIDHKTPEELSTLCTSLMCEPWVLSMFRSPSGDGLKVIVKTDNMDMAHYKNCYRQLEALFEERYGIKPDNKCEAISQGCFASYDPDVYVNPGVQDLHLEYDPAFDISSTITQQCVAHTSAAPKPMSQVEVFLGQLGNGLSDEEIIEIADKRFARYSNNYIDGYRTKAIFVQAATLCKAGIPKEKALKYLKEHFLPTGYDEWKLEYETARAYSKWDDHFGSERGNYRP